jgi:hypothetical protein
MMVLVRASPGQEREATPPSVALLMTDLESLVVGTCKMMPQGTLTYLLNCNHNNKVLNRTILTQILPYLQHLASSRIDKTLPQMIKMCYLIQGIIVKSKERK